MTQAKTSLILLVLSLISIFALALAACGGAAQATDTGGSDMQENGEMGEEGHEEHEEGEHEEGEHEEEEHEHGSEERIPNDGAVIRILGPADGATFAEGEDILVEVEVEGFILGEEGSHWHIYIDGSSWGMVVGNDTDQALSGIEPGEHLLEVYLAGGDHIELVDGDAIHIVIEASE
jgi:hypothetical protein